MTAPFCLQKPGPSPPLLADNLAVERFGDAGARGIELGPIGEREVVDRAALAPGHALLRLLAQLDALCRRSDIDRLRHAGRRLLADRVVDQLGGLRRVLRALDEVDADIAA